MMIGYHDLLIQILLTKQYYLFSLLMIFSYLFRYRIEVIHIPGTHRTLVFQCFHGCIYCSLAYNSYSGEGVAGLSHKLF